jgi:acyl phosphate:glycerol-3-phosphate acyltransferase
VDFSYVLLAAGAYLIGSFPTGYLLGRACGRDIRKLGSGNIGATNAFRILGKPAGMAVLLIDAFKGFLACTLLVLAVQRAGSSGAAPGAGWPVVAGIAAVLGHNYSCWLRFKGGKGVATSAGVLLAWAPLALAIALAVWLMAFALSRYVSLASISAALALPLGVWGVGGGTLLICVTAGLSLLTIFKHRGNIQRLLAGTENRFGSHPRASAIMP